MHILGVYVHVSARYEVSISNAVTGTDDDTNDDDNDDDNDDTNDNNNDT